MRKIRLTIQDLKNGAEFENRTFRMRK